MWVMCLLLFTDYGWGQNTAIDAPASSARLATEASIAKSLENMAKSLIERHLRPEEFQVLVSVQANPQSALDLPYVPTGLDGRPYQDLSPEELSPYIKRVEVEILLADRYTTPTQEKLKAILQRKLALDPSRGDQITFSALGIEIETPQSELIQALTKAQAETREIQQQISNLAKERDDSQRELSVVKTALETLRQGSNQKLAELIDSSRKDLRESLKERQKVEAPPKVEKQPEVSFIEKNLTLLSVGVLILAALILAALTSRFAMKALARSVSAIGEAVVGFGENVSEAVSSIASVKSSAPSDRRSDEGATTRAQIEKDMAPSPKASLEEIQARLNALHKDLLDSLNARTEPIVLAHLGRLLENPDTVGQAVLILELLGKEKANEMYELLDPESHSLIKNFLQTGSYGRPKTELMLEVGEQLKTKLLMEVFSGVRGQISTAVASRVIKLRAKDLAMVASMLSPAVLPRLFLYLDPKRLAQVLNILKTADKTKYALSLKAIAQVPEVEKLTDLDQELTQVLDQQIAISKDDSQRPYFNWYKAIAEASDDDLADELCSQLASASPQLESYVRDQLITFRTLFMLLEDIQEELIVSMSNRNLAALLINLDDQDKSRILVMIDQRRQEVIVEEMESLRAKGQRQVAVAHREAKSLMVANIRALKGSGSLSEFIDKNAKNTKKTSASADGARPGNVA